MVDQKQAETWIRWGERHLGEPDGSVTNSIWGKNRWSRDNPANNYYHSFVRATTAFAMATGSEKWLDYLKSDRLPRMYNYYSTTIEGGSREGTGYGESHRHLFTLAKRWRDYDGTEVLPQAFIDNSIRYWAHAMSPGQEWVALIGDHTRTHGKVDHYHVHLLNGAIQVAKDPEAIQIGYWLINKIDDPRYPDWVTSQDYSKTPGHPPKETEYYAKGAGHFFSRESWDDDSAWVYVTAGEHDEAHQQEDQGAFAVWDNGRWQTASDSPWTRGGIAQDVEYQNVIRFPSSVNKHNAVGLLEWSLDGDTLTIEMDLSEVVTEKWKRQVSWEKGTNAIVVLDEFDNPGALFGFEVPSADDDRAPYSSNATVETTRNFCGFSSVIVWPNDR